VSQQELLRRVLEVLAAAEIDYMVTGSLASSVQGAPRATHDVDLVVAFSNEATDTLLSAFPPPDFYLSRDAITEALKSRQMFNLLDLTSGDKVDFWILTDEPFDQSRFARKRRQQGFDFEFNVSTPEDTILAKLRWANLAGGSEKQFNDALHVYEVQRSILDHAYLHEWAERLELEPLWQQLRTAAERP
jgi:hypothetical protein